MKVVDYLSNLGGFTMGITYSDTLIISELLARKPYHKKLTKTKLELESVQLLKHCMSKAERHRSSSSGVL